MNFRWDMLGIAAVVSVVLLGFALLFAYGIVRTQRRVMPKVNPRLGLRLCLWGAVAGLVFLLLLEPHEVSLDVSERTGLDISFAIDVSKSMRVEDWDETDGNSGTLQERLVTAKSVVERLMEKKSGYRVGLSAYAGAATFFPLTTDHDAAMAWLNSIRTTDFPGGSDMAYGIQLAACLANESVGYGTECAHLAGFDSGDEENAVPDKRGRAVVVLTDGGGAEDDLVSVEVKKATEDGKLVLLVGFGTVSGGRVPELNDKNEVVGLKKNKEGTGYVLSTLDEVRLQNLAQQSDNVRYIRAKNTEAATSQLLDALSELKEGRIGDDKGEARVPTDTIYWIALFMLVAAERLVGARYV